jgi:hypothetical protein
MTEVLNKEWEAVFNPLTQDVHNYTLKIDEEHYLSYLVPNANLLLSQFASDIPGLGGTALCTRSPWKCLILNGDFRKQYEEVLDQGYDACYNLYQSLKAEHGSSWSEDNN